MKGNNNEEVMPEIISLGASRAMESDPNRKTKVRFNDKPEVRIIPEGEIKTTEERKSFLAKAVDSSLGKGVISTFSKDFGLDTNKMTEIVGDYAKGKELSEENRKYIDDQFKKNPKLKQLSDAFPIGGAGNSMKKVADSFDDDEHKKKGTGASNNELFDTKTKVLMGLCIACIILATGGLPLLGGLFGLSQGTLIAGAVLTGLGAMGAIAYNSMKDKNKIASDFGSQRIDQDGNSRSAPENAMESLMKLVTNGLENGPKIASDFGSQRIDQDGNSRSAPENAMESLMKLVTNGLENGPKKLTDEEKIKKISEEEKALLEKLEKVGSEGAKKSLISNEESYKVSGQIFDKFDTSLRDIKAPKLGEDSQLQSKKSLNLEALNLEKPKSDNKSTNTNPSSEASWASKMLAARGGSRQGGSKEI